MILGNSGRCVSAGGTSSSWASLFWFGVASRFIEAIWLRSITIIQRRKAEVLRKMGLLTGQIPVKSVIENKSQLGLSSSLLNSENPASHTGRNSTFIASHVRKAPSVSIVTTGYFVFLLVPGDAKMRSSFFCWQSNKPQFRSGFTLVELLVVIAIIGILIGMLLPGVQQVREAAHRVSCGNNMRQMAIATLNYESAHQTFPSSWRVAGDLSSGDVAGWSAQAQILPFLEQGNLFDHIDFNQSYHDQPLIKLNGGFQKLQTARIPTYLCPNEINDVVRLKNGVPEHYPLNYGVNAGTWFVFDPASKQVGSGTLVTNRRLPIAWITDGTSNTLFFGEVKAYTPYFRNAGTPGILDVPVDANTVSGMGGEFKTSSGHTEWVDGRTHQTGFTATFTPNTVVPYTDGNKEFDIDWTNQQEGRSLTVRTFAAITSRSYHPAGVNTSRADGSVHFTTSSIDLLTWQALSTRNGREVGVDE